MALRRLRELCRLEEIEDGTARGFEFGSGLTRRDVFVLREGRQLYGYENSCPHVGTPLEFRPDQFLSADGNYLLCSTHGALFTIESGLCISGPCKGDSLTPLDLELDAEDRIYLLGN
ncbi:Rieske (2Fe-2S) protein [Rhodovibrionaceae bacterium A322]